VWIFYKLLNSKIFLCSDDHDSLSFEEMPFIWKYGLLLACEKTLERDSW
jgi:hypothetical protein